jgi:hypothetical protein
MILTPRNKNKITADGATMSIHRIFSVGTESGRSLSETKVIWLSLVQTARFMKPYRSYMLLRIEDVKALTKSLVAGRENTSLDD